VCIFVVSVVRKNLYTVPAFSQPSQPHVLTRPHLTHPMWGRKSGVNIDCTPNFLFDTQKIGRDKVMDVYPPGAIWPAEDEHSVEVREVFARYGLAMYQAQVLEHGMVNAVVIASILPTMHQYPDRSSWEDTFEQAYDSELAKTFGNMLRALEPLALPDELVSTLRQAKVERDRLAHRFFREHDENFLCKSGRARMIAECEEIIGRFTAVDAELDSFMSPHRERYGITKEWVDGFLSAALASGEAKS